MSDLMILLPSDLIDALVERLAERLETYPHWLEIDACSALPCAAFSSSFLAIPGTLPDPLPA